MADEVAGERTESATGRRRDKARDKGQVAKSIELNTLFVLTAGIAMLLLLPRYLTITIGRNAAYLFSQAYLLRVDNIGGLRTMLIGNTQNLALCLAPIMAVVLVAAVGGNIAQVGMNFSAEALMPNASKLNPVAGMKRFVQKRTFFELAKGLTKVGIIGVLAWLVIRSQLVRLLPASNLDLSDIVRVARGGFIHLMIVLLGFVALLAVVDWTYQRWQYEEDLKMSKQEVKEENKEYEGDPQIKARIRGMQMDLARQRMLAAVPGADVVVTNPTHLAVALQYKPGTAAPVVVAKGADYLAQKIREIARASRVPVIENKPVARALYKDVKVGRAVPERLFQAVAEILAYVYRLKKA